MQVVSSGLPSIWIVVKIFVIVGLFVYLIFALVIVRQIQIMSDTVKLEFDTSVKILALVHLVFALGLLLFAFISL